MTKTEDTFQQQLASGTVGGLPDIGKLTIDSKFPVRPGYGTRGKPIVLYTNYFELVPKADLVLHRYNIAIQPQEKGKKLGQLIRLLLDDPRFANTKNDIVTDFGSTMISRINLGEDRIEASVQYRAENEDEPRDGAPSYRFRIEKTGTLTVGDLMSYVTSTNVNEGYDDKLPMIQALNIFLGNYAKAHPGIATIGKNKAFSLSPQTARWDLGAGLTALRGFFSSVRVATCRILINVNVTNAPFYDAIPLDKLIEKFRATNGTNLVKLESFLKRVRVKTTHLPEKKNREGRVIPRIKTIFGLATKNDGHGQVHPPRVQAYGAGAKGVEFYLENASESTSSSSGKPSIPASGGGAKGGAGKKGKGQKGELVAAQVNTSASTQGGKYISVHNFFAASKHYVTFSNPLDTDFC